MFSFFLLFRARIGNSLFSFSRSLSLLQSDLSFLLGESFLVFLLSVVHSPIGRAPEQDKLIVLLRGEGERERERERERKDGHLLMREREKGEKEGSKEGVPGTHEAVVPGTLVL